MVSFFSQNTHWTANFTKRWWVYIKVLVVQLYPHQPRCNDIAKCVSHLTAKLILGRCGVICTSKSKCSIKAPDDNTIDHHCFWWQLNLASNSELPVQQIREILLAQLSDWSGVFFPSYSWCRLLDMILMILSLSLRECVCTVCIQFLYAYKNFWQALQ